MQRNIRAVIGLLIGQLIFLLLLAAVMGLVDATWGLSCLLGGLVAVVPNAYFTLYAFRPAARPSAEQRLLAFYRGLSGKFLLSAAGFAALFATVKPLNAGWVFASFVVMMLWQVAGAAMLAKRTDRE